MTKRKTKNVSKRRRRLCRQIVDYMRRSKKPRDDWDFAIVAFNEVDAFNGIDASLLASVVNALETAGVLEFDFNYGWYLTVKTRKPFLRFRAR